MKNRTARRGVVGLAVGLLFSGAGTLAFAASASASPTFNVNPDTNLTGGESVSVSGSGFADNSFGGITECNNDPGQPTVSLLGHDVPVSCSSPLSNAHSTDGSGNLAAVSFTIVEGTVGPPTAGTDSIGNSAAADAANYPCPPTPAQVTAGDTCTIAFGDEGGDAVTQAITFSSGGGGGTTTTTTTTSTTTTTTAPASTTTSTTTAHPPADSPSYSLSCTAASVPVNLPSAITEGVFESDPVNAGATDNLKANSKAVPNSLFGSYDQGSNPQGVNLLNGPDSGLGLVIQFPAALEPATTPGSTVTFSGTLPLTVTGGVGTPSLNLSGSFTVPSSYPTNAAVAVQGTQSGTITAGQGSSMTISQPQFTSASPLALTVAIGATKVPITCTSNSAETLDTATITGGNGTPTPPNPPSPGTATAASASDPPSSTSATHASTLAFTGPGQATWVLAIGGLLLMNIGFLVLTIFYRPREIFAMAGRRVLRVFGGHQ